MCRVRELGLLRVCRPSLKLASRLSVPVCAASSSVGLAAQTRRYNFTITNTWDNGDGHGRPVFSINGKTPGPLIEADEGDEIEVFLDNQLSFDTTMHWYVSIQPRDFYTYRFTVQQQYGSYFYHGHFGPALTDGMRDIEGMKRAEKNAKHVVISDWNAEPMGILLIMSRDTGVCSNSIVLNGKGRTFCHSDKQIELAGGPGRKSLGCLIQQGQKEAHHELQISVDEHELYVVAADGEFVHPQRVHAANCNLGERIRVTSLRKEQIIQGIGILCYPGQENAMDELKLAPYPSRPPPSKADNTIKFFVNMTGPGSWALNIDPHQSFQSRGETTYGSNTQGGSLRNGAVVDIIFENGTNAFIIGTGSGGFPWLTVDDVIREGNMARHFNFLNPPNRSGCRLGNSTGNWTVIRYEIFFPAASMLHCHMIHHFAAGQRVVHLEGVESIQKIPAKMKDRVHSDFSPPLRYGPLD
ncbi:LOW QUALITY PROTEIN: uncharacterized protein LY79DRAFT_592527 [Colletotrichum navitas]|uniref:Multicopper oxidase n=1 Tax=Colletotrichum navitas TaxID=681940 RepID=A0AAD8PSJ7_9PEZI|nr:LOW QUALITY PROTEIN: uncharacterized protein LY79DRAFT_592527 [Colletotrichum navitas]KAK1579931.1 LOW QUALITY PROTEIN: hypothetical protein LY79DRAFT_592527 [Colletotrichum navitas]